MAHVPRVKTRDSIHVLFTLEAKGLEIIRESPRSSRIRNAEAASSSLAPSTNQSSNESMKTGLNHGSREACRQAAHRCASPHNVTFR